MNRLNDSSMDARNHQVEQISSTPSMRDMKSKDIGNMPYAGRVGGEMVRRMIKAQEEELMEKYSNNQVKS